MKDPITLADHGLTAANGAETVTITAVKGHSITWRYDGVNDSGGNAATLPEQDPENPVEYTVADYAQAIADSDQGIT